ncbi:MAG: hypothetical protein ACOZNI_26740 [Myxococcota bacterium]
MFALLVSAVLAQEAPAPAEVWVVFPTRAVNLGPDEVQAADALFRLRLSAATQATPLGLPETRAAMTAGTDDAALLKACAALNCTRWATLDLIRLGGELYVTAMLRDDKGAQVWRVDVVADGIPQLDQNLDRISRALVERVPYEKVPAKQAYVPVDSGPPVSPSTFAEPDDGVAIPPPPVTTGAAAAPPVVYVSGDRANAFHGVRMGTWVPVGTGASTAISVAYDVRWERAGSFTEFDAGFIYPIGLDTFGGLYANLGWSKLVPAGKVRFYFGGGGGPRPLVVYGANTGFGGGAFAQVGLSANPNRRLAAFTQLRAGADVFNDLNFGGYYAAAYMGADAGIGF